MRRAKSWGTTLMTCDDVTDTTTADFYGIPLSTSSYLSLNEVLQGHSKIKHPRSRSSMRPLTSSLTTSGHFVTETPSVIRYSTERNDTFHLIGREAMLTTTRTPNEYTRRIDQQAINSDQTENNEEEVPPKKCNGFEDTSKEEMIDEITHQRKKLQDIEQEQLLDQQTLQMIHNENHRLKRELIDTEKQLEILNDEKEQLTIRLKEIETTYNDLKQIIIVSCLDDDLDRINFERSNENVRQLVLQLVNKYHEQYAMNEQYEERMRNLEANTKKSDEEIKQLTELINVAKPQHTECNDIVMATTDDPVPMVLRIIDKGDTNSISELLRKREEDLERYQIDLRATRTKATEMEVQSAHTKILLEAAETESKAFKETLAMLLTDDFTTFAPTEENIKKRIRQIMSERRNRLQEKADDDKRIESLEQRCAEQARNHRLAIARAKNAENDIDSLKERIESINRELSAIEIERCALEKREKLHFLFIDKLVIAMRLDELRNDLNIEIDEETLIARAEQLAETEIDFIRTAGITQNELLARHLRDAKRELDLKAMQLDVLRKKMRINECANSMRRVQLNVSKLDEINRNLLTKLTIQQLKSNDSEKRFMKHRLEEQSRLIRDLEKKAKEIDRIRNIFEKNERQSQCYSSVEFTPSSKNTNTQLQQMKIRLVEIQNKEAQLSYFRSRVIEVLSLPEDTNDDDIIKHLEELITKNLTESTIEDDKKPSIVRRSQSSDSASRRSNQQTNSITLKKFPAIRTSKPRPKTTFIKWK